MVSCYIGIIGIGPRRRVKIDMAMGITEVNTRLGGNRVLLRGMSDSAGKTTSSKKKKRMYIKLRGLSLSVIRPETLFGEYEVTRA